MHAKPKISGAFARTLTSNFSTVTSEFGIPHDVVWAHAWLGNDVVPRDYPI
jgi:hypothetical protein